MKIVAKRLKDQEFSKHIDDMQLTLFLDNKLSKNEREEVIKHLADCKRCRDVLRVAKEIEKEYKPINNINYKGYLKPFMPFVAGVVIFFGVPMIDSGSTTSFKGIGSERSILDRSLDYWEEKINKLLHKLNFN
jgi:hypothetical protein